LVVKGVDVSSWQHPAGAEVDWWAVAEAGFTFMIVKATQGTSYVNPWALRDIDDAKAAGLLCGAYHFWEPGQPAEAQAKHFYSAVLGLELEMGTWLDWEPPQGPEPDEGAPPGPGETPLPKMMPPWVYGVIGDITTFINTVEEARPGTGYYMDQSWHNLLAKTNIPSRRLWLAAPSLTTAPAGATLWQRPTETVPGIPGAVDVDTLLSARGLNIPTTPPAKKTPAEVRSLVPKVESGPEDGEPDAHADQEAEN
jgi:lysozyme